MARRLDALRISRVRIRLRAPWARLDQTAYVPRQPTRRARGVRDPSTATSLLFGPTPS